jgi:hypothetical protein
MNSISSFSLSLQKQIQNQTVSIDTEINRAFQELKIQIASKDEAESLKTRDMQRYR